MYTALARFGYGIIKSIRPSKVKKLLTPAVKKATTPAMSGTRFAGAEDKLIKGIKGAASKGYKGYRSLYGATVGTPTRRKVTSAGLTGYGLGSFFDDVDES
jgi:hypothetical protein